MHLFKTLCISSSPGGGNKHGSFSTASSISTSHIPLLPLAPHVTHHEQHRERACNKDEDRDSSQQESGCHDPDHQSYHSLATTLQFSPMPTGHANTGSRDKKYCTFAIPPTYIFPPVVSLTRD